MRRWARGACYRAAHTPATPVPFSPSLRRRLISISTQRGQHIHSTQTQCSQVSSLERASVAVFVLPLVRALPRVDQWLHRIGVTRNMLWRYDVWNSAAMTMMLVQNFVVRRTDSG